jgi:hypothetical protein
LTGIGRATKVGYRLDEISESIGATSFVHLNLHAVVELRHVLTSLVLIQARHMTADDYIEASLQSSSSQFARIFRIT